ncbi:MAG: FAD binding domain-containing protein [Nocardioidaceae bacterium]
MTAVESEPFEYQVADCWEEAVELLTVWRGEAKILAGGQSLVPMLNLRLAAPAALLDITPIRAEPPYVDGHELVIPATTRHVDVLRSPLVREHCPLLGHAVGLVGNVRVRNRGTIGGSIAHADPTGEIPCTVLASGGRVVLQGPNGTRAVDAADFFITYLTTAAEPDEVVTEIRLPVAPPNGAWAFDEHVRRYSDFATVEVAVSGETADDGRTVRAATVVIGGVADRPLRLSDETLAPLVGSTGGADPVARVARAASDSVSPESDVHASGDYRRRLTRVLAERTLLRAFGSDDAGGRP